MMIRLFLLALLGGGLLNVRNAEVVLRQQFRCPHPELEGESNVSAPRVGHGAWRCSLALKPPKAAAMLMAE